MLFGFTSAVLVGFLLTAIPNWTGRPTITGAPLAGLAVLWIAGRVLMLTGADLPWQVVAAVDVAFLPLAAAAMLPPLIATKNRRNIVFPFVLIRWPWRTSRCTWTRPESSPRGRRSRAGFWGS